VYPKDRTKIIETNNKFSIKTINRHYKSYQNFSGDMMFPGLWRCIPSKNKVIKQGVDKEYTRYEIRVPKE